MLIPIGTIILIVMVQISFWFPLDTKQQAIGEQSATTTTTITTTTTATPSNDHPAKTPEPSKIEEVPPISGNSSKRIAQDIPPENFQCIFITDESESSKNNETISNTSKDTETNSSETQNSSTSDKEDDNRTVGKGRVWKCACELGFLPAGMLKTFGNAEAIVRLGVGQCYHKQT